VLCVLIRRIGHPVSDWFVTLEQFRKMETGHVVPTGSVERRDSVVDVPSERHL